MLLLRLQIGCTRVQRGQYPCPAPPDASRTRPVQHAVNMAGSRAEVAELVDAPDSKSGSLRGVWVRFPPSAPPGLLFRNGLPGLAVVSRSNTPGRQTGLCNPSATRT